MNAPLIRLAQPALDHREARAIEDVLTSGMLVQGAVVERFERAVAERCGRAHAVAVTNGTAALELALECLEVRGHEVLVPDLTWPSPAHAALRAGAEVALLDVDPATWNVTASAVNQGLSARTKVAIVIDQFGAPADLPGILGALPSSVALVEDAACAIGSTLFGKPCGSFGAISTLSFHPRKVITTGEGGMLLTDTPELAARARMLRNHGQRTPGEFGAAGPNLRLTEMQAAMGLVQLEKLDEIVARRQAIGARYDEALRTQKTQTATPGSTSNRQTYGLILREGLDPAGVLSAMRSAGVECGRLSYALHRLPSLKGARRGSALTVTEGLVDRGIALPLHTRMSDRDVEQVLAVLLPLLS
jgi:perosamine synthetase